MPEPGPASVFQSDRLAILAPGAPRFGAEAAAALEAWHHRCVERTFGGRASVEPWGRLLLTDEIDEPEWNHAAAIRWTEDELAARLAEVETAFAVHRRRPTIAVTPWSAPVDLADRLVERGWTPVFRHLWSLYDLRPPVEVEPVPGYSYARVRSDAEMEEFVELFEAVYRAAGELSPGYAAALHRSRHEPGVRHHLVRRSGEPAAIGTVLVEGEQAQIFNMVVAAGHRGRGLAEWVTQARLAEARAAGARSLTALTDNGPMDRWLAKRGFEPGWFSVGYTPALNDGARR